MQEGWKTYKLGDVAEVIDSLHKSPQYSEEGIPMVRVTDVKSGYLDLNGTFKVTKEVFEEFSKKHKPKKGDIVMTRVGTYGISSYVNSDDTFCLGQNTIVIVSEIDSKFLFYNLNSPEIISQIEAQVTGSTQKTISLKSIRALELSVPAIKEQTAIASILSALDDKIELNLEMNKTLEEMAMALYKHWFVDFGPFQNGEFVDSELGKIPKDWEVKRLVEIATKKSVTFDFSKTEEVVFVNTGDVQEGRFLHDTLISKEGLPGQAKKAIAKDDILYSEIRPKNKRYAYVNFDSSNYVVSTKFMIINPKENILSKLLYRILTMQSTVDNFNMIAEGRSGTFPQITFDAICDMEIVLPPIDIQEDFQNIVESMELRQDALYNENQTLTKLRDTLLPKLISGEVRVKDIEQTISEVL